jgi:hypothetical protein
MNATQLAQMIERIVEKRVSEEISKRLPALVESVLTKRYLKDLVNEQVQVVRPASSRLSEVMRGDEEEEVMPSPMPNTDMGIYQTSPLVKEQKQRKVSNKAAVAKLTRGDSEFAAFFEGTEPVGSPNAVVQPVAQELVPESTLNQMFDMQRIHRLAKATVPVKKQTLTEGPSQKPRSRLDERVGGEPAVQHSQPYSMHSSHYAEEDPFEAKMREIEGRRSQLGI